MQPRFIWGILLNFALSNLGSLVWNVFSGWLGRATASSRSARIMPRANSSQRFTQRVLGAVDVVLLLQVQPGLRIGAEETCQPQFPAKRSLRESRRDLLRCFD